MSSFKQPGNNKGEPEKKPCALFFVQADLRFVEGYFPESSVFACKKGEEPENSSSFFHILSDRYPYSPILEKESEEPFSRDYSFLPRPLPSRRILCVRTPDRVPLILFSEEKPSGLLLAYRPKLSFSEFSLGLSSLGRSDLCVFLPDLPNSTDCFSDNQDDRMPDTVPSFRMNSASCDAQMEDSDCIFSDTPTEPVALSEGLRFFLIGEMISSPLSESRLTHSRRCLLAVRLAGLSPDSVSPAFYPTPAEPIFPFLLSLFRLSARRQKSL